jgi:Bacteriophage protein of unknown function (DUF646).
MMSITIEKADQRFTTRWRWESVATKWAVESGELMERAIKAEAPVSKKPTAGALRDSISFKPKVSATSATVEFTSHVPYARYVIQGTPAHVIMPRNARVLRWQQGGAWVYRQKVNHPGARPNPFPEKALKPLVPVVGRKMRNLIVESMGKL